jgi:type III pantothenate kinase
MTGEGLLLAISVENAAISLGAVRDGEVKSVLSVSADRSRTADEYAVLFRDVLAFHGLAPKDFSHAMICSVAPALTETVRSAAELYLGARAFLLSSGTRTGLSIATDNPSELGGDLVASAVGALARYAPPCLLVSFGTATVISAIDKRGAFIGCAIAPGVSLSGDALAESAALLHGISHKAPAHAIGKNTEDSLRSGSVLGAASMVDGMLSRMEAEMGEGALTVIASGKLADAVVPHMLHSVTRDDTLLFLGLEAIDRKNRRK